MLGGRQNEAVYLAFALVLIRSKPSGVSVEQLVQALKQSYCASRRKLSRSSFWRHLFELHHQSAWQSSKLSKPGDCEKREEAFSCQKRAKLDSLETLESPDVSIVDSQAPDQERFVLALSHIKNHESSSSVRTTDTIQFIRITGQIVVKWLNYHCDTNKHAGNEEKPSLTEVCHAVKHLARSVFRLDSTNLGQNLPEIASVFATFVTLLLECLTIFCSRLALQNEYDQEATALASALAYILVLARERREELILVFKACTSVFLTDLGSRLSKELLENGNLQVTRAGCDVCPGSDNTAAVNLLLGRYLGPVLRVLDLSNVQSSTSQIDHELKERLQHTLMAGTFGHEDPTFQKAFSKPDVWAEFERNLSSHSECQDKSLTGHVWRNVGWDILMSSV